MPIKYAEITIIKNLEKESIFEYFSRLIQIEIVVNDYDTIIILFDDETTHDVKKEYTDKKFIMLSSNIVYPYNFNIEGITNTFFYKEPKVIDNNLKTDFKKIFKNNPKYFTSNKEASIYNVIYYVVPDIEVFSIVKISSNEIKPRYLLAYDDMYFKKDDIIYFVQNIFENFKKL